MDNNIQITITALNEASTTINEAARESESGFGRIKESVKGAIEAFALFEIASKALESVGEVYRAVADEMSALQSVAAQTTAVLKSTGDASGVTAEQVAHLAESLEGASTYSQAAIQSGENILLTFKNIGGSVLPQTTQAVMDMATAMHMDLNSAALQVGKALEDPIGGLTRLQRAGVQFTQAQKDQIKALVDTGQGMAAQKIILDELANEFGGSAAAQAKTFSGALTQLKNEALTGLANFMNSNVLPHLLAFEQTIQSQIVPALKSWASNDLLPTLTRFGNFLQSDVLPVLKNFAQFITGTVAPALRNFWDNSLEPKIQAFASWVSGTLVPALKTLADDVLPPVKQALSDIGDWISSHQDLMSEFGIAIGAIGAAFVILTPLLDVATGLFAALSSPVLLVAVAIAGVSVAVVEVIQHWDDITAKFPAVGQAWTGLQADISKFGDWLSGTLAPELSKDWALISSDVAQLVKDVQSHWDAISQVVSTAADIIKTIVGNAFSEIVTLVKVQLDLLQGIIKVVTDIIHGNWSQAWADIEQTGINIWHDIVSEMGTILGGAEQIAADVWNNVGQTTVDVWNHIITGVESGVNAVIGLLNGMTGKISTAMSDLASVSILGQHPFADLAGFSIPKVDPVKGGTATFSPVGAHGGGGKGGGGYSPEQALNAAMGGDSIALGGASGNGPDAQHAPGHGAIGDDSGATGPASGGGSTDTAPSGAGAGDFSPGKGGGGGGGGKGGGGKGGGGGGGGGAPTDATQTTDMAKVWKDLHDAADAYNKALGGIKDTQPKITQDLLDSEKAMRPEKVAAMTQAYQDYQTAANALAAGVTGGASAKQLTDLNAHLTAAKDQFTAAAKDVTDLDTKINTDTKALHDQRVAEVKDLGDAIITALKAQAAEQLQTTKDSIAAQKDALKQGTADAVQAFTDRKKAADDAYAQQLQDAKNAMADQFQAQKDALTLQQQLQTSQFDAATNAQVARVQAQIDAPKIAANLKREQDLRTAIGSETGAKQVSDQAALDALLQADHDKVLQDQITAIKAHAATQKQTLQDGFKEQNQALADNQKLQSQALTDHYADEKKASDKRYDDLIKAARDNETATNKVLDDQLKAAERHYKAQTDAHQLQLDARLRLEGRNQQDIVDLLNHYDPDWNTAGKNLGQQLIDGLKQSDIPGAVEKIFADMGHGGGGTASSSGGQQSAPSEGVNITNHIHVTAWDAASVISAVPELVRQIDLSMVQGGGKGLKGVGAMAGHG